MGTASHPASVEESLRSLTQELEEQVDDLVETMLARMYREVPDFDGKARPDLDEALRASCYGNLRTALRALGGDRRPPTASPAEASEEARVTARARVSLTALLHTYRVGHAVVWERLLSLVGAADFSQASSQAVLQIGSRYLFSYIDTVSALVTDEYTYERDRMVRSSIQRRVQLVRDVLGGASVGSADLGYDLEAEHLAVIADGPEAETALRQLSTQLQRSLLTVAEAEQRTWAWLGSRGFGEDQLRPRLAAFELPADVSLALGEPAWGPAGFRQSHEQALAAHRVGSRLREPMVRYDDVALEAALLADGQAARRFVERELGGLLDADERSSKLLSTLDAYLRTGLNASAAAAVLGVGDRTVSYRLRTIEGLLDRNVSVRSAELAAALRLARIFR